MILAFALSLAIVGEEKPIRYGCVETITSRPSGFIDVALYGRDTYGAWWVPKNSLCWRKAAWNPLLPSYAYLPSAPTEIKPGDVIDMFWWNDQMFWLETAEWPTYLERCEPKAEAPEWSRGLLADLGSNKYRKRLAASNALANLGVFAIEPLMAGTLSRDPEVISRCRALLTELMGDDWQWKPAVYDVKAD